MFDASPLSGPLAIGAIVVAVVMAAVAGAVNVAVAARRRRRSRSTEAPPWHFASYHLPGRTA